MGESKHTGGHQNKYRCPNIWGHMDTPKSDNPMTTSKVGHPQMHGWHPNVWAVQKYGGIQTYRGHPNIQGGIKTYGGVQTYGAYGHPLSLTTPMTTSKVGKHFII